MKSSIAFLTYKISYDNNLRNKEYGISDELAEMFNSLHTKVLNRKDKKIIDTLTSLIIKYPNAPQLKNFLSSAYHIRGNKKKALEVNRWILVEHPDYLFGKLNQAIAFIGDGEPEKVPEVLGELLEIKALYPGRDEFHIEEVTGFYKVAILYFTAIKNLELAENRFEGLKEIAPGHPDTKVAEGYVQKLRMEKALERRERSRLNAIAVEQLVRLPESDETEPPLFKHEEVKLLYLHGVEISRETIDVILSLPKNSVCMDLELMLDDAVRRFRHFCFGKAIKDDRTFPLHAICLLGELEAEVSLPKVLSFLSEDPDLLDFWLGDHLTETVWQPIYKMAIQQPHKLREFCLQPGLDAFPRSVGSAVLAQIALHNPAMQEEISEIFGQILSSLNNAVPDDNIIDSEFIGLLVGDVIDCGFKERLPVIKALFDKGYVSEDMSGDYDEVVNEFDRADRSFFVKKLQNVYEIYDYVSQHWVAYDNDEEPDWEEMMQASQPASVIKIGRNDPCPCGSGKKFKKCCLEKFSN